MNIFAKLPNPFFSLAPLDDVTDVVFREIVAKCSPPDLFFTEFVNVDGLQSPGRSKLITKLRTSDFDQPIIAQIWGKIPENYYKISKELGSMGFAGVDINMGCPIKAITNNGCCSALINNRPLAKEIIEATKAGVAGKLPVSVKTRLGFNEVDFTWHEFLLEHKLDALTVHGRTKKQMSQVPADWGAIGQISKLRDKISPKTILIGNGDVANLKQGRELASEHNVDGVMIGRGIFNDPFLFGGSSKWETTSKADKVLLYSSHIQLFAKTWGEERRNFNSLKRFAKVYINGFEGAKDLREELMNADTIEKLQQLLDSSVDNALETSL